MISCDCCTSLARRQGWGCEGGAVASELLDGDSFVRKSVSGLDTLERGLLASRSLGSML